MSRTAAPVALAAAVVLLLGGCGSQAPTPHFATVANAVCAKADDEILALPAEGISLSSLTRTAQRELPIVRGELAQLSALTAPSGETAGFARALTRARRALALVTRLVSALRAGNVSRVATLALDGRAADGLANAAMTSLGLGDCAREATPRGRR